jgi:hypothetical protein
MEASTASGNDGTLLWRVGQVEREVDKLDQEKATKEAVISLQADMQSVKRAMWGIAIGLPVGGLTFLAGVQQLVHH